MSTALWLVVGAVAIFAGGLAVRVHARRRPPRRRSRAHQAAVLLAFGAALMLGVLAGGITLLDTRSPPLPEQRGIGVVVEGVVPDIGRGLVMSLGVKVTGCDEPVQATLIASGPAEFWRDHARELAKAAVVRVAIPDTDVEDVSMGLGEDARSAAVAPLDARNDNSLALSPLPDEERGGVTILGASIPRWGRNLRPFIIRFKADWLERRSYLGSCFLRVPSLAGVPTVLSAQEIRRQAVDEGERLPGRFRLGVVSSPETKRRAYYIDSYQTTRGVTTFELGSHSIRGELSTPAPDRTIRGYPGFACVSEPVRARDSGFLETLLKHPSDPTPEVMEGFDSDAAGTLSIHRIDTELHAENCASFMVVEAASASIRRDVTSLFIGAMFSIAVNLMLEGMKRRRGQDEEAEEN